MHAFRQLNIRPGGFSVNQSSMEINPLLNILKDLTERTQVLRRYL